MAKHDPLAIGSDFGERPSRFHVRKWAAGKASIQANRLKETLLGSVDDLRRRAVAVAKFGAVTERTVDRSWPVLDPIADYSAGRWEVVGERSGSTGAADSGISSVPIMPYLKAFSGWRGASTHPRSSQISPNIR
jgi:hypothetical protein